MADTISGFASINGARLFYEVEGEGESLLFIHAGIADSRMWDAQFETLVQHYQLIRFDLRGFGGSDMPAGAFSNFQDVKSVLDLLEVNKAVIIGASFGGLIAIDFALTFPERVKQLILIAPSIAGVQPSLRIEEIWETEEKALDAGHLEEATEVNLRFWVDGPNRKPDEVSPGVREYVRTMQMHAFRKNIPEDIKVIELDPPAIKRLAELKMPVLVVSGGLDIEEKLETANLLATRVPNFTHQIIPDAGHMLSMERPEKFDEILMAFLSQTNA